MPYNRNSVIAGILFVTLLFFSILYLFVKTNKKYDELFELIGGFIGFIFFTLIVISFIAVILTLFRPRKSK